MNHNHRFWRNLSSLFSAIFPGFKPRPLIFHKFNGNRLVSLSTRTYVSAMASVCIARVQHFLLVNSICYILQTLLEGKQYL